MLRTILLILAAGLLIGGLLWWCQRLPEPGRPADPSSAVVVAVKPIRLGLVPEHDIFTLRKSYQKLAGYLSQKLGQPVELVTLNTYEAVLLDFEEKQIDGAFLGSLVAVLAMDRHDARVIVKPQRPDGSSTYEGVLFVREDSPIKDVRQLAGRKVAAVRTTAAGCLFAMQQFKRAGLLADETLAPTILAVGTHDDAIKAAMNGEADAGCAKSPRLEVYLAAHAQAKVRILAKSPAVPNNALLVRPDLPGELGQRIAEALIAMEQDPQGRAALVELGAARFVGAAAEEFGAVYDMVEEIGQSWEKVGTPCTPPKRPAVKPVK